MNRLQMSLRTKVVLSLTFLMASAMLLIGMVMLKVSQRDLIQAKVEQGLLLKSSLEQLLTGPLNSSHDRIDLSRSSSLLDGFQGEPLETMTRWKITVTDQNGLVVYPRRGHEPQDQRPLPELQRVIRLGLERISFTPSHQSFWQQLPEKIILAAPLARDRKVIGALRLEASLADVQRSLGRSQKLLLFYIVLDILILVAFGTYMFSKLVVKPVQQLVQTAEGFQEGDEIPDVSAGEQNELGKLAQALNAMLQRLAENKDELRQHVNSLEQANLELKRAQQEVIFSEKLASVGRLAAGLAHEIGNPIGIVLGYLDLLQRKDIDEAERLELINRMSTEIQRINQTIRQLLDFSRPGPGERQTIPVHPLIRETLAVLDHQLKKQEIEVVLELKAETDTVFAKTDQLKQVFLNLMVNAADAMEATNERPQGGQLRIHTRSFAGESLVKKDVGSKPLRRSTDPVAADFSHLRRIHGTTEDRWIEIQFADTGVGITQEDQERVFDPFFTTKEAGKGTGLGLSVSIQIIETLGGRMEVNSRSGEETVVSIMLPVSDEEAKQRAADSRQQAADSKHEAEGSKQLGTGKGSVSGQ
ncbi:MAG: HAMP domain-containing protein [Deltaproteobacteria bacterium]|nr:HAMP domain-containing protein [Deltaproteobacteria bacterium]